MEKIVIVKMTIIEQSWKKGQGRSQYRWVCHSKMHYMLHVIALHREFHSHRIKQKSWISQKHCWNTINEALGWTHGCTFHCNAFQYPLHCFTAQNKTTHHQTARHNTFLFIPCQQTAWCLNTIWLASSKIAFCQLMRLKYLR